MWRLGINRFPLRNLQMSCKNLALIQGTRITAPAMTAGWHVLKNNSPIHRKKVSDYGMNFISWSRYLERNCPFFFRMLEPPTKVIPSTNHRRITTWWVWQTSSSRPCSMMSNSTTTSPSSVNKERSVTFVGVVVKYSPIWILGFLVLVQFHCCFASLIEGVKVTNSNEW